MYDLDRSDHETSGPDEHDEHWLKMAQWQNEAKAKAPDRNAEIGIAYSTRRLLRMLAVMCAVGFGIWLLAVVIIPALR